uniref:Chloride channel protein n=1 Tax=Chromera velia CCMP2878 TaxID=1169474 RepID=A0A0G4G158_9ALVE|eukprot:Cvel_4050.t1-p1 / transcript=Cvel_4050.t1 / gene=Cvel_4050 / organism=Chromera_velia_CCMP2878 / gene_product=Chloride channel protein CLC-e, putative / transcript_product=Chloride channel protein CLC-e, putative / location=Cvel_scaffold172:66971-72461(+) / protein_length=855 / sequence_SO=supercontig / SO=protein_coding / is_pseudo=false
MGDVVDEEDGGKEGRVLEIKTGRAGEGFKREEASPERDDAEAPSRLFEKEGSLLAAAAATGLMSGLCTVVFKNGINLVQTECYQDLAGALRPLLGRVSPAVLPLLGGLAVSFFGRTGGFTPGLRGQFDELEQGRPLRIDRALSKALASIATLGTGCSLGPEGPSVELGVVCARIVAAVSQLRLDRARLLLQAGAAAGVGAGFGSPVAGLFFALECAVPERLPGNIGGGVSSQRRVIASSILCSVVGFLTSKVGLREAFSFKPPAAFATESPLAELPFYLGLGLVAAVIATVFRIISDFFIALFEAPEPPSPSSSGNSEGDKGKGGKNGDGSFDEESGATPSLSLSRVPRDLRPALAGLFCGIVGVFYPQVLFFQYGTLDAILREIPADRPFLGILLGLKCLLTAFCGASGLQGGFFAPLLFMGAVGGALYRYSLQDVYEIFLSLPPVLPTWLPGYQTMDSEAIRDFAGEMYVSLANAEAYAVVGAASVLSAAFKAPLTAAILLFEQTESYEILLPATVSAGVGAIVAENFQELRETSAREAAERQAALRREQAASDALRRTLLSKSPDFDAQSVGESTETLNGPASPLLRKDGTLPPSPASSWAAAYAVWLGASRNFLGDPVRSLPAPFAFAPPSRLVLLEPSMTAKEAWEQMDAAACDVAFVGRDMRVEGEGALSSSSPSKSEESRQGMERLARAVEERNFQLERVVTLGDIGRAAAARGKTLDRLIRENEILVGSIGTPWWRLSTVLVSESLQRAVEVLGAQSTSAVPVVERSALSLTGGARGGQATSSEGGGMGGRGDGGEVKEEKTAGGGGGRSAQSPFSSSSAVAPILRGVITADSLRAAWKRERLRKLQ